MSFFLPSQQEAQGRAIIGVGRACLFEGGDLEGLTHETGFVDIGHSDLRHAGAHLRDHDYQTYVDQTSDRFSHWRPADLKPIG